MKNKEQFAHLPTIDLNCDLGQGWGVYDNPSDGYNLLDYVTSVNIACGGHAGDADQILKALKLIKNKNIAVGAHLGFPDKLSFGQKDINMSFDEIQAKFSEQLGTLIAIANTQNMQITHVRPHGALMYKCMSDSNFAERLAKTIIQISPWLAFVGPAGNYLNALYEKTGILTIGEVYLDRPYKKDTVKKPQNHNKNKATYEDCLAQAQSLIYKNRILSENNKQNRISFRTIHLTGDKDYSVTLAKEVHNMVTEQGRLQSFHPYYKNDVLDNREIEHIPSLYDKYL